MFIKINVYFMRIKHTMNFMKTKILSAFVTKWNYAIDVINALKTLFAKAVAKFPGLIEIWYQIF